MKNLTEIKKEIEERFEAKFVKDWKLDFEGGWEELTNFISSELSAAIQEFAEAVKIEKWRTERGIVFKCGYNTAVSDVEKKVKEFLENQEGNPPPQVEKGVKK